MSTITDGSTVSREILTGDAAIAEGSASAWAPRRAPSQGQMRRVVEAARLFRSAVEGDRRAMLTMQEAMSTSDFPLLMGTVFGRELMATYQQLTPIWSSFCSRTVVNDFRPKPIIDLLGGRGILDKVPELTEYPARKAAEGSYSLSVGKYGGRIG
ncbi:MAG: hypothetical protein ACRCZP_10195, partial [Phycicoccus sp.]